MALFPIGVLDISVVTDRLIELLNTSWNDSPLWATLGSTGPTFFPDITGSMPESVRIEDNCQLSVYLFHVTEDKFQRNSPLVGPRAATIPEQPLALTLYYLVTAFAKRNYHQEQQAMSIALRCFHEHPIVRMQVPAPISPPPPLSDVPFHFTLTMETQTSDEIARLWQGLVAPLRLSAVYKVSVAVITPPAPANNAAPPVRRFTLTADPTTFPFADTGHVTGTASTLTFTSPESGDVRNYEASPAVVPLGGTFLLQGAKLNQGADFSGSPPNPGTSYRLFALLPPDDHEQEITSWKIDAASTASRIALRVPANVGPLPASAPPPGSYRIVAGSNGPPDDAIHNRTAATPFSIAARVDVTTSPPLLTPSGATYSIDGAGFVPGRTEVLLDATPLEETMIPGSGRFQINTEGTQITFQAPSHLPAGARYAVRIRVNRIESPPSWWVVL